MRNKRIHIFSTGDMVRAVVTDGKKVGRYTGRVAVPASGRFNIQTAAGLIQGIEYIYCEIISRNDGYGYHVNPLPQFLLALKDGVSLRRNR